MKHRGRIQAQGENLEASEAWAQNKAPTVEEGLSMLEKLKNKIPKREADKRAKAFLKAKRFIEQGPHEVINSVKVRSFALKGSSKERVDIEIQKGKAFIK